ncbi:MAG: serine/threonine protein kinase, partial [Bryobacteraceae bacterium]|nr:serine/threonine protein kinase [Bryobacteraceae bacterium]
MTAERWRRIEEVFDLVADLPQGIQEEQLRQACAGDGLLFEQVLALLDHDRSRGGRIAEVIEGLSRITAPEEVSFAGRRLGAYRVVGELGRGGMGVVFEAVRDDDAYSKRVALKVAARAAYSQDFLQRFRHERQILARLEHPHIARLLDGGTTEEGIPFFVMEYVEGEPINDYCNRKHLSTQARLELFVQVCEGVQHAHQKAVIHRDLKPSNILVAEVDGRPVPKIIDFGVAKATSQRLTELTMFTELGQFMGTPEYMSPEQA